MNNDPVLRALTRAKQVNKTDKLRYALARRELIQAMRKEKKTDQQVIEALQGVDHD